MSKLTAVLPRLEPGWEKSQNSLVEATRSMTTCSDNHRSSSMFLAVEDSTAMMRSRMNHVRSLTYEFHSFFGIEEPDIWLFIMIFIRLLQGSWLGGRRPPSPAGFDQILCICSKSSFWIYPEFPIANPMFSIAIFNERVDSFPLVYRTLL